ncbi:triphosphoribosyl-dephospho-CoA synthase [Erysipelothrix tonsillarum]|uniref:triphosphoribosyl-dephospho-CoA synthase n=1 Tax=Erysipelothrix tonsillarum TaxID=38402 RepID=UPI0003665F79|nr:triphosphoribosyl-dephospho-CoA synthase [Erysipelothrix tonsillarum]
MRKNDVLLLALKSLILEVSLYPKPGLVDPIDSGSHRDMNYNMFIDSSFALMPGFDAYFEAGKNHCGSYEELFDVIRSVGVENEHKMFAATGNVNTHKGANFLYGVVIAAIAYMEYPNLDTLRQGIQRMTKGLVDRELTSLTSFHTHGERMYRDYGFTGIRGEVEQGIPHVFEVSLPVLDAYDNQDLASKHALLALIQSNNDTNMVKRGGIEGLAFGKKLASAPIQNLDDHLKLMNEAFIERNLSPGGSADLLALSLFMKMYRDECLKDAD